MGTSVSTILHIPVDQNLKEAATETLDQMGLSLSEAVRLLPTRIAVEKALPFEVRAPNPATVEAMRAGDRGEVFRAAAFQEMMAQLNANG
jgi:DNA-damage-inducible protein J